MLLAQTCAEPFGMLARVHSVTEPIGFLRHSEGELSLFFSLLSAPTAIPRHKMESPCDSMSDASPSPIYPLCEGDGGLHICPQSFTLFFRVFPCLFPFSMYFLHFDAFSSFRRVLFISTHSLHLQRVLFIFDALSSFLICSPHLHYPQATS